jgi:hypothetical protein
MSIKRQYFDGFVKSPSVRRGGLRFFLRHCGVHISTPHSSEFARLASGAFDFAVQILTFLRSCLIKKRGKYEKYF